MTIASTTTRELKIGRIVQLACLHANVLNEYQEVPQQKRTIALELLETILDELPLHGIATRTTTFTRVTVEGGVTTYRLDDSVLNVAGDAMWIRDDEDPDRADGELLVKQVTRTDWHQMASKASSSSTPSLFYVDRSVSPPEITIWPVPEQDGWLRIPVTRLLADSGNTENAPDIDRPAVSWLIYELASQLASASAISLSKVNYLAQMANIKLKLYRSFARENAPGQLILSHRTNWSRR